MTTATVKLGIWFEHYDVDRKLRFEPRVFVSYPQSATRLCKHLHKTHKAAMDCGKRIARREFGQVLIVSEDS